MLGRPRGTPDEVSDERLSDSKLQRSASLMHFYFDLTDGPNTISDAQGVDAADLAEAIEQAGIAIEELRSDGELVDVDSLWELVIKNSEGNELYRMPIIEH
ncbi:hypothetical protein MKK55_03040 [Methylobacterium sp. J-059]|uniref:DUF6894 family protein n=1 Tax=Methylobacterium sp. J-059 TaxID=2836643 RepID=UPI001FBA50FC|nr:hypothetical protein [Methylobacterium sp. J-059]MCJ2037937.1 hypothetical protein [Methylobacterium sp. J-059]